MKWELLIGSHTGSFTDRLKIPGGWLYRTVKHTPAIMCRAGTKFPESNAVTMVFVPEEKV